MDLLQTTAWPRMLKENIHNLLQKIPQISWTGNTIIYKGPSLVSRHGHVKPGRSRFNIVHLCSHKIWTRYVSCPVRTSFVRHNSIWSLIPGEQSNNTLAKSSTCRAALRRTQESLVTFLFFTEMVYSVMLWTTHFYNTEQTSL